MILSCNILLNTRHSNCTQCRKSTESFERAIQESNEFSSLLEIWIKSYFKLMLQSECLKQKTGRQSQRPCTTMYFLLIPKQAWPTGNRNRGVFLQFYQIIYLVIIKKKKISNWHVCMKQLMVKISVLLLIFLYNLTLNYSWPFVPENFFCNRFVFYAIL